MLKKWCQKRRVLNRQWVQKLYQFIIAGFREENELVNPEFDYETQTVISVNNWVGSGEASERIEWEFQNGSFVFSKYLVDQTYDGKVNPILVEVE